MPSAWSNGHESCKHPASSAPCSRLYGEVHGQRVALCRVTTRERLQRDIYCRLIGLIDRWPLLHGQSVSETSEKTRRGPHGDANCGCRCGWTITDLAAVQTDSCAFSTISEDGLQRFWLLWSSRKCDLLDGGFCSGCGGGGGGGDPVQGERATIHTTRTNDLTHTQYHSLTTTARAPPAE